MFMYYVLAVCIHHPFIIGTELKRSLGGQLQRSISDKRKGWTSKQTSYTIDMCFHNLLLYIMVSWEISEICLAIDMDMDHSTKIHVCHPWNMYNVICKFIRDRYSWIFGLMPFISSSTTIRFTTVVTSINCLAKLADGGVNVTISYFRIRFAALFNSCFLLINLFYNVSGI